MEKILEVKNLNVIFQTHAGAVNAIRDISFDLYKGETLAIVGESGSGKSVTTKALMQLLAENGEITSGEIIYKKENGTVIDIAQLKDNEMHTIRGKEIAMVFQDPLTSLNPTMTIGKQIMEPIIKHQMAGEFSKADLEKLVDLKLNYSKLKRLVKQTKDKEESKNLLSQVLELKKSITEIEKKYKNANKVSHEDKQKAHELKEENKNILTEIKKNVSKLKVSTKDEVCTLKNAIKTMKQKYKQNKEQIFLLNKSKAYRKAVELIKLVGINEPIKRMKQYPHQFSGGMRQRIVIAIALACNPKILICDEPTTALDVTIQAQILELIKDLQQKTGCSVIFITHDLGVVANVADRVAVMYAGKICEVGTADEVFYTPAHPYTWGLLASKPDKDETKEQLYSIPGTPPNLLNPPVGDAFALRSDYAMQIDLEQQPPFFKISDTHYAATWLLHKDAPKIEPPKVIMKRYAKRGVEVNER